MFDDVVYLLRRTSADAVFLDSSWLHKAGGAGSMQEACTCN